MPKSLHNYLLFIVVLTASITMAQQEPQYTQYMHNLSIINAAYAGSNTHTTIGILYRNQWTGFQGAPQTTTLFAHTPISTNIGAGISAIRDAIGPTQETIINADIAYRVNVDQKHTLAFGIKAGYTALQTGLTDLFILQEGDNAFSENISSGAFNIGAGVFYYSDSYFISAAVPAILKPDHLTVDGTAYGSKENHLFISGGYVFDITPHLDLKPTFLFKSSAQAPKSIDLNLNARYHNRFELGLSYRLNDAFAALASVAIYPWLKVGFTYDAITSSINRAAPSSFEGFAQFTVDTSRSGTYNPRFF